MRGRQAVVARPTSPTHQPEARIEGGRLGGQLGRRRERPDRRHDDKDRENTAGGFLSKSDQIAVRRPRFFCCWCCRSLKKLPFAALRHVPFLEILSYERDERPLDADPPQLPNAASKKKVRCCPACPNRTKMHESNAAAGGGGGSPEKQNPGAGGQLA